MQESKPPVPGRPAVAVMALLLSAAVHAQGVYTCVDAKGRAITSDRPIAECSDRTQREISPLSGNVRRVLGPTLTAQERAAVETSEQLASQERTRQNEDKRRERALVQRYPDRAAHDLARAEALSQVEEGIRQADKRTRELSLQRRQIDTEMEFYRRDPARAPAALRQRLDENESGLALEQRHVAEQLSKKQRVNARYDEELARLQRLWNPATAQASAPVSAPGKLVLAPGRGNAALPQPSGASAR